MKRILLCAFGTRGDVEPALVLAQELIDRGHRVDVHAPPDFALLADHYGVRLTPVGPRFDAFVDDMNNQPLRALPLLRDMIRAQFAALQTLEPAFDVVVGVSACAAARSFAQRHQIPYCGVVFSPTMVEDHHQPPPLSTWRQTPKPINAPLWWLQRMAFNLTQRQVLNHGRQTLGLEPIDDVWRHLFCAPLLVAVEPQLFAVPHHIGIYTCGAIFRPRTDSLSAEVEAFLAAGPPPVVIGFGSMKATRDQAVAATIVDVVRQLHVRAIVQLPHITNSDDIWMATDLPHDALLPRVAAIVHHGGAGTVQAAARAGIPQVVVPQLLDQHDNANAVVRAGIGVRATLTKRSLTHAMQQCLSSTIMQQRARAFAQHMQRDGCARAADVVLGCAHQSALANA